MTEEKQLNIFLTFDDYFIEMTKRNLENDRRRD